MLFQENKTILQLLLDHFMSGGREEELPPKLIDEWNKMHIAHNLLKLHKMSAAVTLFIEHYRKQGKEISQATAYRFMGLAQGFWGAQSIINKEYWRQIMFEGAQDDHAFARSNSDIKGMNLARKNMIEILRLNKADEVEIDPSKVQQHNNVIFIIGGKDEQPRLLSIKELQELPAAQKQSYIEQFYAAQMPQDVSFIEVKEGNADEQTPDQGDIV